MRCKHPDYLPSTKEVWTKEMTKNYDEYAKKRKDAIVEESDMVNHPTHYTSHPSGIEVIQITEHMNFCLGNAIKYILRADLKGKKEEDIKKAIWYLNRELDRLERSDNGQSSVIKNTSSSYPQRRY